ncbi:hypothetical protein I7I53_08053 [Histoplasma capsulatum var. duboisii H88]|uniref:Rhodopsin domain-containing protein n=1 Tax=Ajellomyces capsulatus (strain H88) TaxID=544711 RepID=A0A8A1LEW0_AJEC8|nr:hypothetical protein I7I53_08053 [Histoplasma capsulatum var. duboisii H88]
MSPDVEGFTLLALGIAFILVRMYARWSIVGPSDFQLDDYLMPLAGIVFTLETVAAHIVVASYDGLTNSYMTPEERAALDPNSVEFSKRVAGSKIQVIGWSFYALILWLVKFCLAIFYSRLTSGLMDLPNRVRLSYVILGLTYIMVALCLVLPCRPIKRYWQINPDPGNICQPTISKISVLIVVIPNVLTDVYLLSIPLPLLWKVNISLRKKLTLMALFSGAAFVMVAAIIRAVTILSSGPEGAVSGSRWACRETFVAIAVSNVPIIHPLILGLLRGTKLDVLFTSARQSLPYGGSTNKQSSVRESRKKARHPLSIPGTNAWGSDEYILSTGTNATPKEITVVQETTIRSDPWTQEAGMQSSAAPPEWTRRGSQTREDNGNSRESSDKKRNRQSSAVERD